MIFRKRTRLKPSVGGSAQIDFPEHGAVVLEPTDRLLGAPSPSQRYEHHIQDFDPAFYGAYHVDLNGWSDDELRHHFIHNGILEGRPGNPLAVREYFVKEAVEANTILEIGPFCFPLAVGENIFYFDVMDKAGLKDRATKIGPPYMPERVPYIHYVSPSGDLSVVDRRFERVVSSHCIEHQPDLIVHLEEVHRILEPGGRYYILAPDHRYCYDHFNGPSRVCDVIQAHEEGRTVHTIKSVVEHVATATHNNAARHWIGDHSDHDYYSNMAGRILQAINLHRSLKGAYVDVHAWQFTPDTFLEIITVLHRAKVISLEPFKVYPTPRNSLEFTAILQKPYETK